MVLGEVKATEKDKTERKMMKKEPYAHLKARNVFEKKANEFNRQIELILHNPDSRTKAKLLIELSKEFLTHLDQSYFTIDRLPLEIFDDFLTEADSIKQRIELRRNRLEPPLTGKTTYYRVNGNNQEVKAKVLDYDEASRKFIVEYKIDGKKKLKYIGRLNIVFDEFDSKEHIEERRKLATKLRRNTLYKLNAEKLFIKELARKYDYIKMPPSFKQNIKRKVMVDLKSYDPYRV